jgi:hypothetical protein
MSHKINGSLLVLGQLLNLKPEALAADPLIGTLGNEPRVWANTTDGMLKFFNGTEITDLGASDGITDTELTTALVPYAKTADVNSAISTAVAGLASDADVTAAVANLVSTTALNNAIDNALAGLDFQSDVLGFDTDFAGVAGRYIFLTGAGWTNTAAAGVGDIVEVSSAGLMTAVAYDVSAAGPGALVWDRATSEWLRWDGSNWASFGGLTGVSAGNGISKNGDEISIKLDGATLTVGANGLKVGDLSAVYATLASISDFVTAAQVDAQIATATSGLVTGAGLTSALNTALTPYAKTADVTADIASAIAPLATSASVTSEISTAVTGLVTDGELQTAIDLALAGLDFQSDVLGLETDFAGVAGRYIMVDGLHGIQAVSSNTNDIVEVGADGIEISVAYDVSEKGPGALVWNRAAGVWLRWNGTNWAEFGGLAGIIAGNGIASDEGVVSVKLDGASLSVGVNGLKVGDLSASYVTPTALAAEGFLKAADVTPIADVVNALQIQIGSSFFPFDSGATVATTHTVTHNLKYQWPTVTVIDRATNEAITPDKIEFTSENELVVTLGVAAAIRVSVAGLFTPAG